MKTIITRILSRRWTEGQAMVAGAFGAFAAIIFMAVGCFVIDHLIRP